MNKWHGSEGSIRQAQGGFSFIGLLFIVVLSGVGLAAMGHVWTLEVKREKEAQLLFIGEQFRRAIFLYVERSPPGSQHYPPSLENLLEDRRYPTPQRYLRRIYRDPMTGDTDWELVKAPDGGIMAIHSKATDKPLKRAGFHARYAVFTNALSYRDWVFSAVELPLQNAPETSHLAGNSTTESALFGGAKGVVHVAASSNALPTVPRNEPDTNNRRATCVAQQRTDLQVCDLVGTQHGSKIKGLCQTSASQRFESCLDPARGSLIPLVVSAQ